jgi:hypothetical protein
MDAGRAGGKASFDPQPMVGALAGRALARRRKRE